MKYWCLVLAMLLPWTVEAAPAGVIRLQTPLQVDAAYDRIYKALEAERFWVVHEANLGEQFARNAEKWGVDYNRNRLSAARSMVFSNIEWANTLANAEPDLLALWPLHLVIYERGGLSMVVLPRLSVLANGSPGESRAMELEAEVRRILQQALAD
jgi:hypothetical protein